MTGRSPVGEARTDAAEALAATHGADLHHLAAMLSGSTDAATALVARTLLARRAALLAAGDDAPGAEGRQLRVDLVRLYLRTAPRRRERAERTRARDAGDVLRTLRPRARAASALRLVEDWDTASVARAVGVRPHRVDALVPTTPGLGVALAAVADQHALTGAELHRELGDELRMAIPPAHGGDRRRWRWLVAAAVPLAVLVGWAAATGGPGGDEDPSAVTAGVDEGPRTDLSGLGWELDEEGEPPRGAMGLLRSRVVTVSDGASQEVSWPSQVYSNASFGVLWCDMPPAQDANLAVPSGTITVDGEKVRLPCAGREGSPPVTRLVPLPPSGSGRLQLEGDLPPGGGATLGVYEEDSSLDAPLPRGSLVDSPPVPRGSVLLDPADTVPAPDHGMERSVLRPAAVEVGHDSRVRLWVGRTGAVTVMVDGQPATDDGDYRSIQGWVGQDGSGGSEPPRPPWREQRPDLRWGRWLAWVPGEVRTFDVPEGVRPAPGERDTVTVQVMTENVQEHVQVAVLDARRAPVDTAPVPPETAPAVPVWAGGHRLVGAWRLPLDGHPRELLGAVPTTGALVPVGLVPERDLLATQFMGAPGTLERDGEAVEIWYDSDVARALEALEGGWAQPLPPGDGAIRAAGPAAHGAGEGLLLLYEPVAYEDFDFSGGGVPPGSWRVGDDPPSESTSGVEPLAVVGPEDLEDGTATLVLPDTSPIAARVTTEGRGRIRFQIGDFPADNLWSSQGWWSSWTDEPVVSEVTLSSSEGMGERELTLEVEDYEEFTVEVLAPGHTGP